MLHFRKAGASRIWNMLLLLKGTLMTLSKHLKGSFELASRKRGEGFPYSHSFISLLEHGAICFHFLFLFLKLENRIPLSLSPLKSWEYFFRFLFFLSTLGKGISGFSFFSRNWRKRILEFSFRLDFLASRQYDWSQVQPFCYLQCYYHLRPSSTPHHCPTS